MKVLLQLLSLKHHASSVTAHIWFCQSIWQVILIKVKTVRLIQNSEIINSELLKRHVICHSHIFHCLMFSLCFKRPRQTKLLHFDRVITQIINVCYWSSFIYLFSFISWVVIIINKQSTAWQFIQLISHLITQFLRLISNHLKNNWIEIMSSLSGCSWCNDLISLLKSVKSQREYETQIRWNI